MPPTARRYLREPARPSDRETYLPWRGVYPSIARMKLLCLCAILVSATPVIAAEQTLKVDRSRSYVDIDVDATANFTGRLEKYDAAINVDEAGRIKGATFKFAFRDLKTGKAERDEHMIRWLGGGEPAGEFRLGVLALTPDGQGQATGRLTMNGRTQLIEFPVNVTRNELTYTITGSTTIDHRNWGLKPIRVALLFKVNPEVKVRFQITGGLPPPPEQE
jgi:polyisoprenoid-binding protein YceI